MAEFIDYNENHQLPLMLSLAGRPLTYKRQYLSREDELAKIGQIVNLDVITELAFADAATFHAEWLVPLVPSKEGGRVIAEDEERFLQRARTRAYVVEEHDSNA